ncbi:hypothetical protein RB195_005178 [Necator americanus]|uniref:Uncharacterized protein n=1 Tax=Necator americanus TaxID=51031 RepID=A0ABR1BLL3_NECAM
MGFGGVLDDSTFLQCMGSLRHITMQASYEDEEDAYHARPDDPYDDQDPAHHHRYDSDYAVKTYGNEVPSHDYEYSTYDTEASTGRGVPSGNHKMSYHDQLYDNACRFESNGYKDEEYYREEETDQTDDTHFGHNPHYSERYGSMEGTSDYRDEYRQQYPGDYWNEQEPLSYNSRPPQSMQPLRSWHHDSVDATESATEKENCLDEQNTYEDTEDRNSKMSHRTSSVEKTERRYDNDSSHRGGYYADDYDDRRTDSRAYNWRYDSIQEEDHVKEDWHDEKALRSWRNEPAPRDDDWHHEEPSLHDDEEQYAAEGGYQADREDSSRQNSVERSDAAAHQATDIAHQTIQEEDEKRTPHELWHWAYKQVCKSLGYKTENVGVERAEEEWRRVDGCPEPDVMKHWGFVEL